MEFARLGDIADLQCGYAFQRKQYVSDGIPIIRIGNLSEASVELDGDICYPEEFLRKNRKFEIKKGDILLAMSGTTAGKAAIYPYSRPALLNQRVCRLTILKETVSRNYLFHILKSEIFLNQARRAAYGCAQLNISCGQLADILLPLPPRKEQLKTAEVLDVVQGLIDKRKEQINLCDRLIDSLFYETFGDLERNDKNWEETTIGSECYIKGGKRLPEGTKYLKEASGYPYLRAADLKDYGVCGGNIVYLPESVHQKLKNYTISKEDVYLTIAGENLGIPGIVPGEYDGANLTENAVKLVIKNRARLNRVFLARFLGTPYMQRMIRGRKMAAGVPKLAIFRIERMKLLLPPGRLQENFATRTDRILRQKSLMLKSLEQMERSFYSILDGIYRGGD